MLWIVVGGNACVLAVASAQAIRLRFLNFDRKVWISFVSLKSIWQRKMSVTSKGSMDSYMSTMSLGLGFRNVVQQGRLFM